MHIILNLIICGNYSRISTGIKRLMINKWPKLKDLDSLSLLDSLRLSNVDFIVYGVNLKSLIIQGCKR